MNIISRIGVLLATGFGLGYSPVASGTVGSLPGVLLVALTYPHLSWTSQLILALCTTMFAIPCCEIAERHFGKKDDGRIVADEYMTFPICMIGLPITPVMMIIAFVTNRVFDIIKPPPARGLQSIHGGFGIVIDDVFATLYSLLANHLILFLLPNLVK